MNKITRFVGRNSFLSNFYSVVIRYQGHVYPSVEHAFQAAKTLDHAQRSHFAEQLDRHATLSAAGAKRAGRRLPLRSDWEEVKLSVMEDLLRIKFNVTSLRAMLLDTGDAELIEGNNWKDTFWGVDDHFGGDNHLGRLLMKVRDELR